MAGAFMDTLFDVAFTISVEWHPILGIKFPGEATKSRREESDVRQTEAFSFIREMRLSGRPHFPVRPVTRLFTPGAKWKKKESRDKRN